VFCSNSGGTVGWYSPSRRNLRRPPESPFNPATTRYGDYDYDYACAYGDRLPAPSPVYSRHGYVRRSSPSNQCAGERYARGDGDGHFEPDGYQDNSLYVPDGRSPYRKYDDSVGRPPRYYEEGCGVMTSRAPDGSTRRNNGLDWTGAAMNRMTANRKWADSEIGNRQLPDRKSPDPTNASREFPDSDLADWKLVKLQDRKSADRKLPHPENDNRMLSGRDIADQELEDRVLPKRKSPDPRNANRKFMESDLVNWNLANWTYSDRKSAYFDDSVLITGSSGDIYSADFNTGTVQRRTVKTSTSSGDLDELRAVDGMERRHPVGTESAAESPYRKEKDRMQRGSPHRAGTGASPVGADAKNGVQNRSRAKVDDIKRLTERDRVPAAATQNRKQQQNHVTTPRAPSPRIDESAAKQTRNRVGGGGHKTTTATSTITTSGRLISVSGVCACNKGLSRHLPDCTCWTVPCNST